MYFPIFRKKEDRQHPQGEPTELFRFPFVFQPKAEQLVATAGLEEMLNVYWNDYPDHSRDRLAGRLQRHRRRTVLWHRLLRRRRPRPSGCHFADPAIAWKDLTFRSPSYGPSSPAKAGDPV